MTTDNTKNVNKTTTCLTPKLLLKTTSNKPNTATTSMIFPSAPIATGVFILPIKPKNHNHHRRGGNRHPPKHLRKPPSFDSYLLSSTNSNTTTHYMTRTPSLSSSYSSTSSFVDNVSEYTNEEMMYGYSPKSNNPHRHRRVSSAYRVRFAETSDDGSSIVSSSSSVDEWDDLEIEEEEEDYIFVARQSPPHHYFDFHKKNST